MRSVTGNNRSEITGMKRSDIWMVRKNERGEWQRPEAVEGELNTEWDGRHHVVFARRFDDVSHSLNPHSRKGYRG